jgi:Domain of unknown function (DUF4410)
MMRRRDCLALASSALVLAACSTAKVTVSSATAVPPARRPAVIYVADFDLDAAAIKPEGGLLGARPAILPQGPLGIIGRRDPETERRHLIDLLSQSLVDDLTEAGFSALRVPAGAALPHEGWLVRGVVLEVDEGNRLRRAVIGFGAGETQLQLAVAIDDLAKGTPAPFYQVDTSAESRKVPGAVVTLNPYVAAARFVLAKGDLDRNAKDSAREIAKTVAARVNAASA